MIEGDDIYKWINARHTLTKQNNAAIARVDLCHESKKMTRLPNKVRRHGGKAAR